MKANGVHATLNLTCIRFDVVDWCQGRKPVHRSTGQNRSKKQEHSISRYDEVWGSILKSKNKNVTSAVSTKSRLFTEIKILKSYLQFGSLKPKNAYKLIVNSMMMHNAYLYFVVHSCRISLQIKKRRCFLQKRWTFVSYFKKFSSGWVLAILNQKTKFFHLEVSILSCIMITSK